MPRAPSNGRSPERAPYRSRSTRRTSASASQSQRAPTDSSDDEIYLRKRTRRQILSPDTTSSSGASTPRTTPLTTPQKSALNSVVNDGSPAVRNGGGQPGPSTSTQGSDSSPARITTPATPAKGRSPSLRTLADLGLADRDAPPCPNYSGYSTLCLKDGQIEWEKAYSLSPQHRPVIERMVSWFNSEDMTREGISQVMRNDPDYRELFRKYRGLLGVRIGLLRQEFLPDAEGYEIVHVGPASNGATATDGPSSSSSTGAPAAAETELRNGNQSGNGFLAASL